MNRILRKLFIGDIPVKEYSTITIQAGIKERVFLQIRREMIDISQNQWVLCLDPIVFGVWISDKEQIAAIDEIGIYKVFFTEARSGDRIGKKLAVLRLSYFDKIEEDQGTLFLLKLVESRLFHTDFVRVFLLFNRYYKKPGFSFRKFKSFVSAYSYPRKVNIISFRHESYYNIFPMDLTGEPEQTNRFVFGLRHSNLTLSKIIEYKKLVKSDVSFQYKDIIYQLGKHHGTIPPPLDTLPFPILESEQFRFYIPAWAEKYREIEIVKTMNLGSHMLLWGKSVNEKTLSQPDSHLFHIHFLLTFYLLRRGFSYPLA
jgi:hypothetical protein